MEKDRPPLEVPRTPGTLDRALALVRLLRVHCAWDAEQTAATLVPHLIEETHEVVDAIHAGDPSALEGELGDLLLNLAFQIVVAEETGALSAESVTERLIAKMVRRHPHLFGGGERESWEALKARERRADADAGGVLSGLAKGLDPLTRAHRIQERVAGVGFDWSDYKGALLKVAEELEEVRAELEAGPDRTAELDEELGDLLFAVVNLVRLAGHHPTTALAAANLKFHGRFQRLERLAKERGIVLEEAGLEKLDELWEELKTEEG
jgi:MazG family protein